MFHIYHLQLDSNSCADGQQCGKISDLPIENGQAYEFYFQKTTFANSGNKISGVVKLKLC